MTEKPSVAPRTMPRIVVAGASGFVGQALVRAPDPALCTGLGRQSDAPAGIPDRLASWRRCDLFSLRQVEDAVAGAEVGVYLVHSMMPASRLLQGRFQDLDLICADNFARAARLQGLKRIIYLGGPGFTCSR